MPLHDLLLQRQAAAEPIRVGVIGAGKFGSMFLAQARRTAGLHVMAIAELSPERARTALDYIGWPEAQYDATSFEAARQSGKTHITEDAPAMIAAGGMEVIVDATGVPAAGIRHALLAAE